MHVGNGCTVSPHHFSLHQHCALQRANSHSPSPKHQPPSSMGTRQQNLQTAVSSVLPHSRNPHYFCTRYPKKHSLMPLKLHPWPASAYRRPSAASATAPLLPRQQRRAKEATRWLLVRALSAPLPTSPPPATSIDQSPSKAPGVITPEGVKH